MKKCLKVIHCHIDEFGEVSSKTLLEFGLNGFQIHLGFVCCTGFLIRHIDSCSRLFGILCHHGECSGHVLQGGWRFKLRKVVLVKDVLWVFVMMFSWEFRKFVFVSDSGSIGWDPC